ncbi:MAG: phage virion morphogenesis protein [Cetobacterium sp.]|uniref:phage virion morphogenesis protein n=1 Tax=Cetobacterium sp. TaxID=2071632 RepID=UPI003F338606
MEKNKKLSWNQRGANETMGIKLSGLNDVNRKLKVITGKYNSLKPVMKNIAQDMRREIELNFKKEQSFDGKKWRKSRRAKIVNGQTLTKTSRLRNSFSIKSGDRFARVGTNLKYAARLNFGAKKGEDGMKNVTISSHYRKTKNKVVKVKSYTAKRILPFGDIPAYRFLGINQKMKEKYQKMITEYILGGE